MRSVVCKKKKIQRKHCFHSFKKKSKWHEGGHLHILRSTSLSNQAVILRTLNVCWGNTKIRQNPLGQKARKEDEGFHDELMCVQIIETAQSSESAKTS